MTDRPVRPRVCTLDYSLYLTVTFNVSHPRHSNKNDLLTYLLIVIICFRLSIFLKYQLHSAQSSEVRFPTHKGTNEECDDIVLLVVICNFALTNLSNGYLQSNILKKRKLIIQIKL